MVPRPEKRKYEGLTWLAIVFIFLYMPISTALGDMILICVKYGSQAYFREGLRIVKHKPYTLSTGVTLSENLSFLGFLIGTGLWMLLVILSLAIACPLCIRVKSSIRRRKSEECES